MMIFVEKFLKRGMGKNFFKKFIKKAIDIAKKYNGIIS